MVFEKVRNMIATQLQVDPASITMESRLVEGCVSALHSSLESRK